MTIRVSKLGTSHTRRSSTHPELMDCIEQHRATKERIERIISGLTLEQFNWAPIPGRWSIAQNINHLNLEYREQLPIVEHLIEYGKQNHVTGSGGFRHGRFGNFYCRFTEPPYRVKVPTLDRFKPPVNLSFEECLPEFTEHKDKVFQLIEAANGLPWRSSKLV